MRRLILLIILINATFLVNGQKSQVLEVKGYGRVTVLPDKGVLNIEIVTIQKEFGKTVTTLNQDYDKLIKHLESSGINKDEIKTKNFSVNAHTVYRRESAYDSGFVGRQSLIVEFENNKETISKLIETMTVSPVQARLRFSFIISEKKREEIRNEVIELAIADARQKANLISKSSRQQLGKLIQIKYGTFQKDYYLNNYSDSFMMMEIPATEQPSDSMGFDVKEITLTDQVILVYGLK